MSVIEALINYQFNAMAADPFMSIVCIIGYFVDRAIDADK